MLLWVALGVVITIVPSAAPQAARAAQRYRCISCPAESPAQAAPAIGIRRTTQSRVRKQVIGNPPSSFDDMKVSGQVVVSATVNTTMSAFTRRERMPLQEGWRR
jgi:hypothetical protein